MGQLRRRKDTCQSRWPPYTCVRRLISHSGGFLTGHAMQGYSLLFSLATVACNAAVSRAAVHHLAFVLIATWSVFAYRDVWPLATYSLQPLDQAEGPLLWIKFAFLTFAATVVPLLVPRQYIPVDPSVRCVHLSQFCSTC